MLRRPARRRQDVHRQVDCARAQPRVLPLLGRRADRRRRDQGPPAHVRRRDAGQADPVPQADADVQPRRAHRRGRQAGARPPGRPRVGAARSARPVAGGLSLILGGWWWVVGVALLEVLDPS
eukprot:819568-Prymnesium_polylepis.1